MNRFYSSLVINGTIYPKVHQVFKPRYNKEFFKRLTAKIDLLDEQIKRRVPNLDWDYDLKNLKEDSSKFVKLKDQLESRTDTETKNYHDIKAKLYEIEDRIMPLAVKIPNRSNKDLPIERELVIDELKSDFQSKQNLTKVLDHRKLSFINRCYSKSVVGPNSYYYFGIGAKLQYALNEYFAAELEANKFISTSGMCLVKSAVVEATNSPEYKAYTRDPSRILDDEQTFTTLHLVEASKESLMSFVTTLGLRSTNDPLRLMISGAGYKNGTDWFDSDDKRVSQFQTTHTLTVCPSIEKYSMKEYTETRQLLWNMYKKLQLPTRLIQCNLDTMLANEYDASRIDVWLPSRKQWLPVCRISHYLDYITVRMGLKRGHLIDCSVYDGQVLGAAIIENNQTSGGKFIIPQAMEEYFIHLSEMERQNYFSDNTQSFGSDSSVHFKQQPLTNSQNHFKNLNLEQRRYLVRRNYLLAHSKEADLKRRKTHGEPARFVVLSAFFFFGYWIDWSEIWRSYMPDWFRRFTWNKMYRPAVVLFYKTFVANPKKRPNILRYEEFDPSYFTKSHEELKSPAFLRYSERRALSQQLKEEARLANLEKGSKD